MVLGAQGVMYNILFFSYLISPKTVHRFVGALEEEATRT
jgi:ubiquinol oxidase